MNRQRPLSSGSRIALLAACCCLAGAALLASTGCSGGTEAANPGPGSGEATIVAPGVGMGGPAVDVNVSQAVVDAKPKPADQTTPESAVRSYLDWTSYAYRLGVSKVAASTMTGPEDVRVDSYIQVNLQRERLIDQTLASITFGKPSVGTTSTLVPAKEQWTYSYLSIAVGNKVLEGPYSASYDSAYTVVKDSKGVWRVDSVKATSLEPVK